MKIAITACVTTVAVGAISFMSMAVGVALGFKVAESSNRSTQAYRSRMDVADSVYRAAKTKVNTPNKDN